MADAVVQKENLTRAQQSGLLKSKRFEILLSNAKNEPLLTLEHLHAFVGSLADAFKLGSDKAHNPNPSVLKIIAGSETITHQDIKFALDGLKQEDVNIPGRGLPYIKSTLYPEDVIAVIDYLRQWLAKFYAKETKEYSWAIPTSTLEREWQSAVTRKGEAGLTNSIAEFSQRELQDAVEELFTQIEGVLQAKTQDIAYDSIDDFIKEVKEKFATEPEKTWQKFGLVLVGALAESKINTPAVVIPNKNFKVSDARLATNVIYDQITAQIEKIDKDRKPEKPWDRTSASTKTRFNSNRAPYFSTNEIQEINITISDTIKASSFIDWIDQLLEELKKEPVGPEAAAAEAATEEGGGEQISDEQVDYFTQEEVAKRAIDALIMRSGKEFLSYFSNAPIDPNQLDPKQQDWLLVKLPSFIQTLLNQTSIQQELKAEISNWISANLTLENKESGRYGINADQFRKLNSFLAQQLFAQYITQFLEWMGTAPSTDELKKSEPVGPDIPPDAALVPPAGAFVPPAGAQATAPTADRGEVVDRNKFIRDTTTGFLGLYFETEGEAFREIVFDFIAQNTPEQLTTADLLKLRLKLFNELQLNKKLYEFTQNYYQQKLTQLGLDDALALSNFYNTLDSILVLIEDPQEYLSSLSEEQIIEYFGLEGKRIDIKQLRTLLLGLVFIRRAHYFINRSTSIKPWYGKNQGKQKLEQTPQCLGQLRSFVKATGEEGVMALNLDEEGIDSLTIDERRKELIRQLYRDLWLNTIAGKSTEELMEIYVFYGINIVEVDFSALPVPQDFMYSDMAQHANLENPTPAQAGKASAAKKLFSQLAGKGKQKLGKLALSAVQPELAPILKTLEELPVIGGAVADLEEKVGDLLLKAAGVLGAGLVVLIGLLARSVGALIGGIAGGILGGVLGTVLGLGPWGTAAGAVIGAGIGSGIGHSIGAKGGIGGWFNSLGGSGAQAGGGAGAGGVGAGAGLGAGGGVGPAMHSALVPATIGGTMVGTVLIITTAGGSMLHPITNFTYYTTDPGTGKASPYVQIVKDASPKELPQPGKVTYSISIAARGDYNLTVTDATDKLEIRYNTKKYPGGVPNPSNTPKTIDDFPELSVGTTVNAGEVLSFTYTTNYTSEFQHANIINYFTLSFDYSNGTESGSAQAMSLTSVKFGEAPSFDGCWPVAGAITQLPFGGYSHISTAPGLGADAVDIAVAVGVPVYTSFGGSVIQTGSRGNYGTVVVITGDAGSFIYAHLSATAVGVGNTVSAGDVIGLSGNTGASSGPHLHYERANNNGVFYATPLGSSSTLLQLHEAAGLKVGDKVTRDKCGSK